MKQRAPRNKTLTVTPEEAKDLQRGITKLSMIEEHGIVDKVINADLKEALCHLPEAFADLIIIDPPYNIDRKFGENRFCAMSNDDYERYLDEWFGDVCRCLKPNGSLYMCGDWRSTSAMQRVIERHLTVLNRITWQREKGRGAKANWKNGMEDIWFAVKNPEEYTFNIDAVKLKRKVRAPYRENGKPKDWIEEDGGRYRITHPSNFWDDISIPFWSMPENTDHPTQKPEKLYAKLILASTNEGDTVFDPFMGSGTAPVVAKKLKRHYCGIDINEEYCRWALKRLEMADNDSTIQGYSDGIFWERNSVSDINKARKE